MSAETPFSSKRFLLALMLAACSVILLKNDSLSENSSFLFELVCLSAGLALCFLCFVPRQPVSLCRCPRCNNMCFLKRSDALLKKDEPIEAEEQK
jgi:hypothetical protein